VADTRSGSKLRFDKFDLANALKAREELDNTLEPVRLEWGKGSMITHEKLHVERDYVTGRATAWME